MSLPTILQHLSEYDTALVANTIPYLDPTPNHEWYMGSSIASITPELGPTVGVAVTIEVATSTPGIEWDFEPFYDQVRMMEEMPGQKVMVVKTIGSRPDHECVLGDGVAKILQSVGCVGMVTNGGVRDVAGLLKVPFAAYARGRTVHYCAWRFSRPNVAVEIGGVTVNPGDVIHADGDGVLKIPSGALEKLPERLAAMLAFEHRAHGVFRDAGVPIDERRRRVSALLSEYGFSAPGWTKPRR
jgi:4-hydroxy-4-methyl-2-oxoglutarate aldolase